MPYSFGLYLPQDRLYALATGKSLPTHTIGAALFADISGFTQMTERLTQQLGARRGIEELTQKINQVYSALIDAVDIYRGTVINFAGDAITCWFDAEEHDATARAVACALAMQTAMASFDDLALKVAVTSGPARRFIVGDPAIQYIDTLAGATIARLAAGEQLALKGEVLLDNASITILGSAVQVVEWRSAESRDNFAVLGTASLPISPTEPGDLLEVAPAIIKPWLLPAVYIREEGGFGAFLTELRPTVALFLRFEGIDYDKDEAAGEKLDDVIRQVQASISRYEGTLLQVTIGDKGSYLYAAFGAPIAHEDDAARALQAALELQQLSQMLPFLRPVQIGVSSGTTRAGAYGGNTRRTYGVLGDDVNLAARLMTNADSGEILVSSSVQKATASLFLFEPRLPLRVKGKRELLTVFTLAGLRRQRAIRLEEPSYLLPMIGRQAELSLISDKLRLALQKNGQLVGITAEAGMGKSRLVAEVIRVARGLGFSGYGGVCESSRTKTPYLVWKGIWQAIFSLDTTAELQEQQRQLETMMRVHAPQRLDALPVLGSLLDIPIDENDFTRNLSPLERRNILNVVIEDCLRSAAVETPLLLVLEDIHWIDSLSLELLDVLATMSANMAVVFVLAYRPLEAGHANILSIESLPRYTRIALDRLGTGEAEQLIQAKLAQLFPETSDALPTTLVSTLLERAEGNPFYLEELLNYLRDQGINLHDTMALKTLELPSSLHTLILSRIDQLSEEQKATLKAASIIGRLFKVAWLHGYYPLLGNMERVKDELDTLSQLELTPLDTPEPELSYLFKHIVTREVTYESLPYATRSRLHEQLAQFIEGLGGDSYLDLLAYHYGLTENRDKQREYFPKAGEAAYAAFANDAALDYYARVLPLLDEPSAQIDIYIRRGEILELTGRWSEAESEYHIALDLTAGETNEAARIHYLLARIANSQSDYATAADWQEKARATYARLNNSTGLAHVLLEMAHTSMSQGNFAPARQQLEQALELGRTLDDQLTIGRCLIELGKVAYLQSDLSLSRSLISEGLTIMRTIGRKQGQAVTLNILGVIAGEVGDRVAQQAFLQESLSIVQQIGDRLGTAFLLLNLGSMASAQGDFETARNQISTGLQILQTMGEQATYAEGLLNLGGVELLQGDYSAARQRAKESLAILRSLGSNIFIVLVLVQLEWIAAILEDDFEAAQAALEEGLSLAREMDNSVLVGQAIMGQGHLALEKGDHASALDKYRLALKDLRGNDAGRMIVPMGILGMIAVAAAQGDFGLAARLAAFSVVLRDSQIYQWNPLDRRLYERAFSSIRAGMYDDAFNAAWVAGKELSLDDAVRLTLGE